MLRGVIFPNPTSTRRREEAPILSEPALADLRKKLAKLPQPAARPMRHGPME